MKAKSTQQGTKAKSLPKKEKKLSKEEQKKGRGGARSKGGLTAPSKGINPVQHSE